MRDPVGGAVSKGPKAVLEWVREHGRESIERGPPEEIRGDVARCIGSAAEGGGHILCSSGSILESSPGNLMTMISRARKMGRYPR